MATNDAGIADNDDAMKINAMRISAVASFRYHYPLMPIHFRMDKHDSRL